MALRAPLITDQPIPIRELGPEDLRPREIRYVSVVLPCLNEEEAVGETVLEAYRGLAAAGVEGEVLVVDNGSTDRSVEVATEAGARVIHEERRGYGAAHLAGIAAARGNVIVMADADQTYDLEHVGALLAPLYDGADMVVGSRLKGNVAPGAMPVLHRYVGTPVITRFLRVLTGAPLSDSQSGYRAFWRDDALQLGLRAPGMEYASEMLLRAVRTGLDVREVPSDYRARVGESKLNTISDGWRHIRMLLIMSPHLSLVYPGMVAILLGLVFSAISLFDTGIVGLNGSRWLPIFAGPTLLILGAQGVFLGVNAAARCDITPVGLGWMAGRWQRADALNALLRDLSLLALAGVLLDGGLLVAWLAGQSGPSLIGLAGLAQAAIIAGVGGIAGVLSADHARESIWG